MKVRILVWAFALASVAPVALAVEEVFCDPVTSPEACQDDIMSIRFEDMTSDLRNVQLNQEFISYVTIDVKSEPIAGFSYGVQHDVTKLVIPPANEDACINDPAVCNPTVYAGETLIENADCCGGFNATAIAERDLGFISAIVLSLKKKLQLPLNAVDYKLCKTKYKVVGDPGEVGTKIFFTNNLNPIGSPPTAVNLTTGGKSKQPKTVRNGMVYGKAQAVCSQPNYAFYFGPEAKSGEYAIPAGATEVPVVLRNKGTTALGFSMGIKKNGGQLTFESTLGTDADRLVELVISKGDGTDVTGAQLKGNSATGAPANNITDIVRGPALTAFDPGDFLGVDLAPAVGGPGATVGYAADVNPPLANEIPAVADPEGVCGVNSILVVKFVGAPPKPKFSRGDANGDSKINVTDGVVIAQNIFAGKFKFYDCELMLDTNDDGKLNTLDPVYLLQYIFLKGTKPNDPFRKCAEDDEATDLTCVQPNCTP